MTPAAYAEASGPTARDQGLPVLVIEDSPLIRERLIDLIDSCEGFGVTAQAETEAQAMAELDHHAFAAAVVDLQLREGSGFGVLKALHQMRPQPLTIVLTNSSMRAVRERCMALGAHYFFDKSNEFDRVAEALDTLRARSAAGASAPSSPQAKSDGPAGP